MAHRILITGCASGGKSTLIAALRRGGHITVAEPGRRIIAQERATGGAALPWVDMVAFAQRAADMARADLLDVPCTAGPVFFDRGLVDAAVALQDSAGVSLRRTMGQGKSYDDPVFLAPPWPEIFVTDDDRRQSLSDAIAEFQRIVSALRTLGHHFVHLPKAPVAERVDFVLRHLPT